MLLSRQPVGITVLGCTSGEACAGGCRWAFLRWSPLNNSGKGSLAEQYELLGLKSGSVCLVLKLLIDISWPFQ